jgi:hypothetical protein
MIRATASRPWTRLRPAMNNPAGSHSWKFSAMTAVWIASAPNRQLTAVTRASQGSETLSLMRATVTDATVTPPHVGHHVVVLVLDVVAVHDVQTAETLPLDGDRGRLAAPKEDGVLGATDWSGRTSGRGLRSAGTELGSGASATTSKRITCRVLSSSNGSPGTPSITFRRMPGSRSGSGRSQ